jgi:hypothetical protein
MSHITRYGFAVIAAVVLAGPGCTRSAAHARRDAAVHPARASRIAALDSANARRLCAAPDSVLAGRAPCVLRNQAPPVRVF